MENISVREEIQALLEIASPEALALIASGSFEVTRMARTQLLRSLPIESRRLMKERLANTEFGEVPA